MQRAIALVLCASVTACATAGGYRVAPAGQRVDPAVLGDYVKTLPIGENVRVDRTSGPAIRGALLKTTETSVIVQARTRLPVPPLEVPFTDIVRIAPDEGRGGLWKAIGIGAAAGVAGAVAFFFIVLAALD